MMSVLYDCPVTEQCNPLTTNIDVASSTELIDLLYKCDQEIFNGWNGSKGIFDGSVQETVKKIQHVTEDLLHGVEQGEDNLVVLSGCGTSGRLAFMISKAFNRLCQQQGLRECYGYMIAGGDRSLFTSQEATEDNPNIGRQNLIQVSEGKKKVLYIGITCGLSAAYVASQLDYCLDNPHQFVPVLLGFNPVYLARNKIIENWDKTFHEVTRRLESYSGLILNPVIGPEPITGSTRMKSGSTTKILLEAIFLAAHAQIRNEKCSALDVFKLYQIVQEFTFTKHSKEISSIVDTAGKCLNANGHIYYASLDQLGIVGLLDASECPPTYGAVFEDVRGFIGDGYPTLENKEGTLTNAENISLKHLDTYILPGSNNDDMVIVISKDGNAQLNCLNFKVKKVAINFQTEVNKELMPEVAAKFDIVLDVPPFQTSLENTLPPDVISFILPLLVEISCKWICNVVTTGAHILRGKIYENTMVDVRVSNNKLYYRAIGIIQQYSGLSKEEAEGFLLKSIHQTDELNDHLLKKPKSSHLERATQMEKVVPMALLMAVMGCSLDTAMNTLAENPVIRVALLQCLGKPIQKVQIGKIVE